MSIEAPQIEATYRPEHGVHHLRMQKHTLNNGEGDLISVLSQPDPESLYGALDLVDPNSDMVAGPELATVERVGEGVPDISDIRGQKGKIERGIKVMREFSGDNPGMIVTLSTPTFNGGSNGIASSFLFFRDGDLVAHNNQQFAPDDAPERWFLLEQVRGSRTPHMYLSGIVGVDLVAEASGRVTHGQVPRPIGRFAKTVVVSGGVSLSRRSLEREGKPARRVLRGYVEDLMKANPDIDDLVIIDSVPDLKVAEVEGPINAHFVRTSN